MSDPQTLEQFETFVRSKGESELTCEQLVRFDALRADITRARRAQEQQNETVQQIQSDRIEDLELTLKEGFHDRQQIPLWIVQLSIRIDRATFDELKHKAKQLGGWYSSFKNADAGFQFKEQQSAEKFMALLEGDIDRSDELAARKDRKLLTTAERLTELAEDLRQRAVEVLAADADKVKNTVRRAEMAAGTRSQAYADQAFARTLQSIAAAFETGTAKYLDGLKAKTQLAALLSILRRAKTDRNKQLLEAQGDLGMWERHNAYEELDNRPLSNEDADFARLPYPWLYKRTLQQTIFAAQKKNGVKQAARRMERYLDGAGDFVQLESNHDYVQLTDFLSRCRKVRVNAEPLEQSMEDLKRLRAANIYTLPELRSTLRELVPHLATKQADDPIQQMEQKLIGTKIPGFFPTPVAIISRMLEHAEIDGHHTVLEPSAGKGDIADLVRARHPEARLQTIETNYTLSQIIEAKGHELVRSDFLEFEGTFDRIVMNPPFEQGQDAEHVRHAYEQLTPGGRLVSIMCEGPFFRTDRQSEEFRGWLEERAGESEQLPEDAFKCVDSFRHTGVRTRLVVINKPAE